jgi:hypothetical protein
MYYKGFDEKPNINFVPQEFSTFDREGFTLIEWGGTELSTNFINL